MRGVRTTGARAAHATGASTAGAHFRFATTTLHQDVGVVAVAASSAIAHPTRQRVSCSSKFLVGATRPAVGAIPVDKVAGAVTRVGRAIGRRRATINTNVRRTRIKRVRHSDIGHADIRLRSACQICATLTGCARAVVGFEKARRVDAASGAAAQRGTVRVDRA